MLNLKIKNKISLNSMKIFFYILFVFFLRVKSSSYNNITVIATNVISTHCDNGLYFIEIKVNFSSPFEDYFSFPLDLINPPDLKLKCIMTYQNSSILCFGNLNSNKFDLEIGEFIAFPQKFPKIETIEWDYDSFIKNIYGKEMIINSDCSQIKYDNYINNEWGLVLNITNIYDNMCIYSINAEEIKYNFKMKVNIMEGKLKEKLEKIIEDITEGIKKYEIEFIQDIWVPILIIIRKERFRKIDDFSFAFCNIYEKISETNLNYLINEGFEFDCNINIPENKLLIGIIQIKPFYDYLFMKINRLEENNIESNEIIFENIYFNINRTFEKTNKIKQKELNNQQQNNTKYQSARRIDENENTPYSDDNNTNRENINDIENNKIDEKENNNDSNNNPQSENIEINSNSNEHNNDIGDMVNHNKQNNDVNDNENNNNEYDNNINNMENNNNLNNNTNNMENNNNNDNKKNNDIIDMQNNSDNQNDDINDMDNNNNQNNDENNNNNKNKDINNMDNNNNDNNNKNNEINDTQNNNDKNQNNDNMENKDKSTSFINLENNNKSDINTINESGNKDKNKTESNTSKEKFFISIDYFIIEDKSNKIFCPDKPIFTIRDSNNDIQLYLSKQNDYTFMLKGHLSNGLQEIDNKLVSIMEIYDSIYFSLQVIDNLAEDEDDQRAEAHCTIPANTLLYKNITIFCTANKISEESMKTNDTDITLNWGLEKNRLHEDIIIRWPEEKRKIKHMYSYTLIGFSLVQKNYGCFNNEFYFYIYIYDLFNEPDITFEIEMKNPIEPKAKCKIYESSILKCYFPLYQQRLEKFSKIDLPTNYSYSYVDEKGNTVIFMVDEYDDDYEDFHITVRETCGDYFIVGALKKAGLDYFKIFLIVIGIAAFAFIVFICFICYISYIIKHRNRKGKYMRHIEEDFNNEGTERKI